MLYKIKNDIVIPVKEKEFKLEKDIQKLVENNLFELLGLKFICTEFNINNYRLDTLAYDEENKSFIIIEYKRGRNESLVDQGYTYLNILLDRKADFILKYNEAFNENKNLSDFDFSGSRVIFVSPKFTDYQMGANDFMNSPIDLIRIVKYEDNIIELDRIVKKNNAKLEFNSNKNNVISKVNKEIKTYTEEDHFAGKSDDLVELYDAFKSGILNWSNIDVDPKKMYIAFKGRTNIVDFIIKKKKLYILVNLKKGELSDPKNIARDVSTLGRWGNGDYEISVNNNDNLEYILSLIKQSWEKNKK